MHKKSKGKAAMCGTMDMVSHIVHKSVNDVYDFDQQDTSHVSLKSKELVAEFRSPRHIKGETRASRKCVKNKKLYTANAVIEASHSGKTSTPCAVTGLQKTKKKILGTPVPWVALSRVQQNCLAAYTVSPIAVEHHSPNDLSRQIDVDSMFDDTSSVMDDSAVFITKSKCQEYNSEKCKSETDSGYPKFDSQCEFISLSAGDNVGKATERSKIIVDDLQKVNLPVLHNVDDSGDDQHIISAEKQVQVENMLKPARENRSADSDCEVILYKPGVLNPKKFNSLDARSSQKHTTKRHLQDDDIEPDSDVGESSLAVEDAASLYHKPSHVLRTRNAVVDSNSASALSARYAPSIKDSRKTDRKTESAEMSSGKSLHSEKLRNTADTENADMLEKPKSRRKPTKKQNTESGLKKQTESVRIAKVKEKASAGGPDTENGDADCKCIIDLY